MPDEAAAVRGRDRRSPPRRADGSHHENRLVAADGTRRNVSWVDALIPDERGQFRYVLVCGLDVTERNWHEDVQAALRRVATLVASGTGERELMAAVTSEIGELFERPQREPAPHGGRAQSRIVGAWNRDGTR